jgi:hypothetical protein
MMMMMMMIVMKTSAITRGRDAIREAHGEMEEPV